MARLRNFCRDKQSKRHTFGPARGNRRCFERLEDRIVLSAEPLVAFSPLEPLNQAETVSSEESLPFHKDTTDTSDLALDWPLFDEAFDGTDRILLDDPSVIPLGSGLVDPAETFLLHSLPEAKHTIFLDFDGHTTTSTSWNINFGDSIVTPAYSFEGDPSSFTNNELARIQRVWSRVSEDFAPFNVNVTTEDPGFQALQRSDISDDEWGIRIVIGANTWYSSAGGVAFVGSFSWANDTPAFVFNTSETGVTEAVSHEVGHTLGLFHDGTSSQSYYPGHGSNPYDWGPIMGVAYNREVSQWSQGEYADANNQEDDLSKIVSNNGFGYRADDFGNDFETADSITPDGTVDLTTVGIIEQNVDVDLFSFMTGAGNVAIDINAVAYSPNLNIRAELYNASQSLVATSDPDSTVNASFDVSLDEGTYYIRVTGTGHGDPLTDGYTDYGSLGKYVISGQALPMRNTPPVAEDDSASTDQDAPVVIPVLANDSDPDGDTLQIASFALPANGTVTANGDGTLTYTPDAGFNGSDSFAYTVTDGNGGTDTATVHVSVHLTDVDATDLIAHLTFDDGTGADTSPLGNDNSGIFRGGATTVSDAERGEVLELKGDRAHVHVPSSSDINLTEVTQRTIALHFSANDVTDRQVLYEEGGRVKGMGIYIEQGLLYVGVWGMRDGPSSAYLSTPISENQWHHVSLTLDTTVGQVEGYLDGTSFGSAAAGARLRMHKGGIGIGRVRGRMIVHTGEIATESAFVGRIDDVRIYNRVLSDNEMRILADNSTSGTEEADLQASDSLDNWQVSVDQMVSETGGDL